MILKVVAGLFRKNGKVLLVRRPFNKRRGGLWEFPGGKVEKGETLEEAIKRELSEELGVEVKVKKLLDKIRHRYPEGEIELYLLEVESEEEPKLKEAIEEKWVDLEEAERLELCPADKKLLKNLRACKKQKIG